MASLLQSQEHIMMLLPQQLTSLPAVLIGSGLVLLMMPRLRQFILDALETLIASFLLLVLITVVLGLPFAAVYIAFKGVMFTLTSIAGMPYLHDLVSLTAQAVARQT